MPALAVAEFEDIAKFYPTGLFGHPRRLAVEQLPPLAYRGNRSSRNRIPLDMEPPRTLHPTRPEHQPYLNSGLLCPTSIT